MKKYAGLLVLIPVILLIAVALIALQSGIAQNDQSTVEFKDRYHITTPPLPEQMQFAGEDVPLDDWFVHERLEKELLVNTYWQSSMMLMLKRTKRYFPVIEAILQKQGIPADFKYLALAESGLTDATSSSGAKGIWQFMTSTAESYGLQVDTEVDERYHLQKSTLAACKYLKHAKDETGSCTMAAAAYNRGLSGIKGDRKRQKMTGYYHLYLNSETSRYVFRILALKLIAENPNRYGYHLESTDYYQPIPTYEAAVDTTISDLANFAIRHGTTYRDVKLANPWLRDDHLTVKAGQSYKLNLPAALASSADPKK